MFWYLLICSYIRNLTAEFGTILTCSCTHKFAHSLYKAPLPSWSSYRLDRPRHGKQVCEKASTYTVCPVSLEHSLNAFVLRHPHKSLCKAPCQYPFVADLILRWHPSKGSSRPSFSTQAILASRTRLITGERDENLKCISGPWQPAQPLCRSSRFPGLA